MSTTQLGPGWWRASDGMWYSPEEAPGLPQGATVYGPRKTTNVLAIVSLVLSIIWIGGLGSLSAIILGFLARRSIKRSQGREGGLGQATAGIVIGAVGVVATVAAVIAFITVYGQVIVRAYDPEIVTMGTTVQVSGAIEQGVQSITVLSVEAPLSGAPTVNPGAGKKFAAADVRICAGLNGAHDALSVSTFALMYPSGSSVESEGSVEARLPALGTNLTLASNQCRSGYVTFQVAKGTNPDRIAYVLTWPIFQWKLASRRSQRSSWQTGTRTDGPSPTTGSGGTQGTSLPAFQ